MPFSCSTLDFYTINRSSPPYDISCCGKIIFQNTCILKRIFDSFTDSSRDPFQNFELLKGKLLRHVCVSVMGLLLVCGWYNMVIFHDYNVACREKVYTWKFTQTCFGECLETYFKQSNQSVLCSKGFSLVQLAVQ